MKMHTHPDRVTCARRGRVAETDDALYAVGSLESPTCRDRLVTSGPEALRDSELLTVALGTGEEPTPAPSSSASDSRSCSRCPSKNWRG